ncbi:MFS transporter [Geodermatophilus sabuli]|uniref:Predicted arabinose efflux permease, MFS family n=1 Tax=Geodermatophilus sabuli TaxID=1564158 RepID=A0A285EAY5_9ACTN|nr:MFS transporter [Geodermatophilus sabuli]SNX96269.1 Predicted arabinose efflux permease, MFS family [Geodermatophilus sabuli]
MTSSLDVGTSPSTSRSLWRLPALRALVFISLAGFTSFCATLSALPSWATAGGATPAAAGLVIAVMLGCTVLTQVAVPALGARLGWSRLFAIGLAAMGLPALGYLLGDALWWLMAVSAVRGAGFAVVTVVGATLTARIAPPGRQGEAVGIYSLSSSVPNLLAVPAGVALTLAGHFEWVAVLAAAPVLAVPFVGALGRGGLEPRRGSGPEPRCGSGPAAVARRPRRVVLAAAGPAVVLLVAALGCSGLVTFLPIGRPDGVLATLSLLLLGATAALTRWRAGALADRTSSALLLPAGLGLCATGLLLVAGGLVLGRGAGPDAVVLVGATAFGVGWGTVQNLTLVAAFGRVGPDRAATAGAVWNAAFDTGLGVGALVVGAVAGTALGLPWTYVLCALLVALSLPLAVATTPRTATGVDVPVAGP